MKARRLQQGHVFVAILVMLDIHSSFFPNFQQAADASLRLWYLSGIRLSFRGISQLLTELSWDNAWKKVKRNENKFLLS